VKYGRNNRNGKIEALDWPALKKRRSGADRLDREELLQLASNLIEYLHDRACGPRFRPYPTDKDRVAFQRVLVAAIQAYGGILRDSELDELKRRLNRAGNAGDNQRRKNGNYT